MNTFWVRLRSSFIFLALLVLCLYFGGVVLFSMLLFVSAVALFEYDRALGLWGKAPATVVFACLFVYMATVYFLPQAAFLVLFGVLLVLLTVYALSFPKFSIREVAEAAFGMIYVPVSLSFIYLIREMDQGIFLVWIVCISAWGSDVFAYLFGSLLGKHQLAPKLSPHKTVEGSLGGVLGAPAVMAVFGWICQEEFYLFKQPIVALAIIGLVGAVIGQIGDLAASAIKRDCGIKDFGSFIPGHGGFLDRFDSVLALAPAVYMLLLLVG